VASGWQLIATAAAAMAVAALSGRPDIALAFAAALAATAAINLLKLTLRRPRPVTAYVKQFNLVTNFSFPSGHSAGSLLVHGLLAWFAPLALAAPWALPVSVALWTLVVLVGLSRIYLGAHFPTDVLGGWLFGGLALWLIVAAVLQQI
jgi:undecaprenyl-diphosphatase